MPCQTGQAVPLDSLAGGRVPQVGETGPGVVCRHIAMRLWPGARLDRLAVEALLVSTDLGGRTQRCQRVAAR